MTMDAHKQVSRSHASHSCKSKLLPVNNQRSDSELRWDGADPSGIPFTDEDTHMRTLIHSQDTTRPRNSGIAPPAARQCYAARPPSVLISSISCDHRNSLVVASAPLWSVPVELVLSAFFTWAGLAAFLTWAEFHTYKHQADHSWPTSICSASYTPEAGRAC